MADFTNYIRTLLANWLDGFINKAFLPIIEILFWVILIFIFDLLLQKLSAKVLGLITKHSRITWIRQFYAHKVFRTLIHFVTIYLILHIFPYTFQKFKGVDKFAEKSVGLLIIFLIILFIFRVIDAIIDIYEDRESEYTVGVRTFGQLTKIFVAFFGVLTFIATLINISLSQIFTVLGALTAVVLLIFRDSILGFISGLQISTSKSIKIGDWISVSKYNTEGIVKEINLTVTKIEKFDKTVATIPTYDLISTEVTNNSWMTSTDTRRIKRPIVFNIKSFQFCDDEFLEDLEKIDLITDYIQEKRKELQIANENVTNRTKIINGRQLTNIGVFRIYAINYLRSRPDISQNDRLVVRQLELTPIGMPLEVYCFANTSTFDIYEQTQADIFDHLITASKEFGLEVAQPYIIQQNND